MNRTRRAVLVLLLLSAVLAGRPAFAGTKTLDLPDGAKLQMTLPDGWAASWTVTGEAATAEISGEPGTDAKLLVTALPDAPLNKLPEDAPSLRKLIESQGQKLLPTAVQETLTITELHPPEGAGFLYHLTDRNPEKGPGDYKEMHQGALLSGGRMLTATILSHPNDAGFVAKALAVLGSLRVTR